MLRTDRQTAGNFDEFPSINTPGRDRHVLFIERMKEKTRDPATALTANDSLLSLTAIGLAESFAETHRVELPENDSVRELYWLSQGLLSQNMERLQFHGWGHHFFNAILTTHYLRSEGASSREITEGTATALTADYNYLTHDNTSHASDGESLQAAALKHCGFGRLARRRIKRYTAESDGSTRGNPRDLVTRCHSDADTSLKFAPYGPWLTNIAFEREGKEIGGVTNYQGLAGKIISEQLPLWESGRTFYAQEALSMFGPFVEADLTYWQQVCDMQPGDPVPPKPSYDFSIGGLGRPFKIGPQRVL